MKRVLLFFIVLTTILLVAGSSLAFTLTEDFTGAVIHNSNLTTTTGLNQWNDLLRWQIMPTGGNLNSWAQHTPRTDLGNEDSLLFYGFDATGLGVGTPISLNFDFINGGGSHDGVVYIGGLDTGESISQFAGWFNPNQASLVFYSNTINDEITGWTPYPTINTVVDADHDVLFIGFKMGGTDGTRGIDNVNLQVGGPAVPEPATMLLVGTGLVSLAGFRKKFRKK